MPQTRLACWTAQPEDKRAILLACHKHYIVDVWYLRSPYIGKEGRVMKNGDNKSIWKVGIFCGEVGELSWGLGTKGNRKIMGIFTQLIAVPTEFSASDKHYPCLPSHIPEIKDYRTTYVKKLHNILT